MRAFCVAIALLALPVNPAAAQTAHAVGYTAADMVEAYRFLEFVLTYQSSLEP